MIELMTGLPSRVIGFKASGEVTKEDYDNVVFPEVKSHLDTTEKLNYVFLIDTPLKKFSVGAWVMDAWLGLKEIVKWHKVAIVTNEAGIRSFTDKAGHFMPGEYKGFSIPELGTAIQWANSTLE